MSKIKTNRGAAKRFRRTGTRKKPGYKCASSNRRHILTKKSTKRLRSLRKGIAIDQSDMGRVDQMLPNA